MFVCAHLCICSYVHMYVSVEILHKNTGSYLCKIVNVWYRQMLFEFSMIKECHSIMISFISIKCCTPCPHVQPYMHGLLAIMYYRFQFLRSRCTYICMNFDEAYKISFCFCKYVYVLFLVTPIYFHVT